MNKKEQMIFINKCAILIESGISLGEALEIIIEVEKSVKKRKILNTIKDNVEKGLPLSKSLLISKIGIKASIISMIKSGEDSGALPSVMKQVFLIMEKESDLKKKILGALVYPAFIAIATLAMTLFLVMYIFPKIIPLFYSMNIELPFITKLVKYIYEFFVDYGWISTLVLMVLFTLFFFLYKKHKKIRHIAQQLLLFSPFLGQSIKYYILSISLKSISTLLDSGKSLVSVLGDMKVSSDYGPYRESWGFCQKDVEKGISLSESMKRNQNLFPILVSSMLFIGERSGSFAPMLSRVSDIYEQDLEAFIKKISSLLEPVLMIIMGLVVGSVALSIILPIYEITNHLTK